jgi:signal transduction histidine kinase
VHPLEDNWATTDVLARTALRLVLASDAELDAVIVDALRIIGTREHADRAYITTFAPDGTFRNSHEWCADGVPSHQSVIVDLQASDFPWSCGMAARGEIAMIESIEDLPPEAAPERASFGRFGVKSVLQVPMFVRGTARGIVGFNHLGSTRRWAADTVELVASVADALAMALLRRDDDRELRLARDQAERANHAKSDFLSRVSHELRTPLHTMLGFTELLQQSVIDESDRDCLNEIGQNGRRLLGLVDDLLEATRLAAGELAVDVRHTRLRPMVERIAREQRARCAARGVHLILGRGLARLVVLADEHVLSKVLSDLITNAVQRSSEGGVIDVDASVDTALCRITVHDDSAVSASDQNIEIAETFSNPTPEVSVDESRGLGVGLVLLHGLASSIGATLQLERAPGFGTTAAVRLPLAPPQIDS